jgi:drug/metabolite transporter (DMT)-like permease
MAVFAWSFGPLLVRAVGASTPTVVFWRMWMAQPFMIGVAYLTRGRLSWPLLRRCLVPGVLFALSLITSFASYQATSIANATLIGALQPAVIMLVAPRLFGDRSSPGQMGCALLSFVGMAIVVIGAGATSGASLRGDMYAVANLTLWTVYFIRVKRIRNDGLHAPSFLAGVFLVAAVTVTPWALFFSHDLGSLHIRGYLFVLLMVLGPGLLGHGSMTWAQRHLDITLASQLTLVQPALSTLWAWIIYGERLVPVQLFGAAVVLGGLVGVVRYSRRTSEPMRTVLSAAAD